MRTRLYLDKYHGLGIFYSRWKFSNLEEFSNSERGFFFSIITSMCCWGTRLVRKDHICANNVSWSSWHRLFLSQHKTILLFYISSPPSMNDRLNWRSHISYPWIISIMAMDSRLYGNVPGQGIQSVENIAPINGRECTTDRAQQVYRKWR